MTWLQKARRVLELGITAPTAHGERLILEAFVRGDLVNVTAQLKALIDLRLQQGEALAVKKATRAAANKRRLDRRYLKRHGRPHPNSGPLHAEGTAKTIAKVIGALLLVWLTGCRATSPPSRVDSLPSRLAGAGKHANTTA